MPTHEPNPRDYPPTGETPKFGRASMILIGCGALFAAGLFIFFVVYGIGHSVTG